MKIKRIPMNKRMSTATIHNGVVYLAGCCADTTVLDIEAQAKETCANIEKALESAGSDKRHMLSVVVYLVDIEYFAGFNAVYDDWVDQDHLPVRTAIVVADLVVPGTLCEVTVTASVIEMT